MFFFFFFFFFGGGEAGRERGREKERERALHGIINILLQNHISTARFHRGAVAQSIERANAGEEVPGSIPTAAARFLLVGSVSV